jgi:hypothetical protein
MTDRRAWAMPEEPGMEVKAVRDNAGDLWIHEDQDAWSLAWANEKHPWPWDYVMGFAPLADATEEIETVT